MQADRRAPDTRLDEIKRQLDANTEVTNQIKEILDGFAIAGKVARFLVRWSTRIALAVTAVWGVLHLKG